MSDEIVAKPDELLALDGVTAEMFGLLKEWFDVGDSVPLDLSGVDSAVGELGDPQMIAALAMRKLQALHLLATPGVRTSTDVVLSIVQDLQRALVQAPAMRLKYRVVATDWDRELARLADPGPAADPDEVPRAADDQDAEVERFRELHAQLLAAVEAVVRASDGEIRYLE